MTSHSVLSASSAHRWLACPPAARFGRLFPSVDTQFSNEGTVAHQLAQVRIADRCMALGLPVVMDEVPQIDETGEFHTPEMRDYVDEYVDFVVGCIIEMDGLQAVCLEHTVEFDDVVPVGFGTADVLIVGSDSLTVIDLKYGMGVGVSAIRNPQLMLYAYGALRQCDGTAEISPRSVTMWIAQPRRRNYSEFTMRADAIAAWAQGTVRETAILAYQGAGEFKAGAHCQFCPARKYCKKRMETAAELGTALAVDPANITSDQLAALLPAMELLRKTAADIEELALERAMDGEKIDGYEVKQSRGRRRIEDLEGARQALRDAGYNECDFMKPAELQTLTTLKKLMGPKAFDQVLGSFVVQPASEKMSLVRSKDAAPVEDAFDQAFNALGISSKTVEPIQLRDVG